MQAEAIWGAPHPAACGLLTSTPKLEPSTLQWKWGVFTTGQPGHFLEAEIGVIPLPAWQEYTEELYKKGLHGPDNHDGVITHLEPDILECQVKWA